MIVMNTIKIIAVDNWGVSTGSTRNKILTYNVPGFGELENIRPSIITTTPSASFQVPSCPDPRIQRKNRTVLKLELRCNFKRNFSTSSRSLMRPTMCLYERRCESRRTLNRDGKVQLMERTN